MFDGPISDYVFDGFQNLNTRHATFDMKMLAKPYSAIVRLPFPLGDPMTDDEMTNYGRRIMDVMYAANRRGERMGAISVQQDIKKALGL